MDWRQRVCCGQLDKVRMDSVTSWIGQVPAVSVAVSLVKRGWSTIQSFVGNAVSVGVSLFKSGWSSIKSFFGLANGGIIGANGGAKYFASGGRIMNNGRASWWNSVQKYADGTPRAHGTMFVAGEAGPEVVGHVNGRTEVLNKSQIAEAIRSAVLSAMEGAINSLCSFLSQRLADCANAVISAILFASTITSPIPVTFTLGRLEGNGVTLAEKLEALSNNVGFTAPAFATGTVMTASPCTSGTANRLLSAPRRRSRQIAPRFRPRRRVSRSSFEQTWTFSQR